MRCKAHEVKNLAGRKSSGEVFLRKEEESDQLDPANCNLAVVDRTVVGGDAHIAPR